MFFVIIFGVSILYFYKQYRDNNKFSIKKIGNKKENIKKLREDVLSSLKSPNFSFDFIVGQQEGFKALQSAICNPSPQHVIIYGPSGVGKTTATKIVLQEAKRNKINNFNEKSKLIKIDTNNLSNFSKNVTDLLIGSVKEPIYQLKEVKIPRIKQGLVTKAHNGILLIDDIGNLHSTYMERLLKVIENKKVYLQSPHYNPKNENIPQYLHNFFQIGLPANFQLVGVTTKSPGDLPLALRKLCKEIYFRPLEKKEIETIIKTNCKNKGLEIEKLAIEKIAENVSNGEEAMTIMEIAITLALAEGRKKIISQDIEEIIEEDIDLESSKITDSDAAIGLVKGLINTDFNEGRIIEIEASAIRLSIKGQGRIIVTGVADNVENQDIKKDFCAMDTDSFGISNILDHITESSIDNTENYDIHVNFINHIPSDTSLMDMAIGIAIYSAIFKQPIKQNLAIVGGIKKDGRVREVENIGQIIETAIETGCGQIIIPKYNYKNEMENLDIEILPVESIKQAITLLFDTRTLSEKNLEEHDKIDLVATLGNNKKK